MLYLFDGKNGNGKTLGLVRHICVVLEQTSKIVVEFTGSLKLPELNEFLHERAAARGDDPPDLDKRLISLPQDLEPEYYRYRAGGLVLPEVSEMDLRDKRITAAEFREKMIDYFKPVLQSEETRKGCIYILDEAQDYFNSRDTMENGRAAFWHIGKHRHLDDDIVWATPAYEELDVRIRRKVHRWYRIVNCYNLKLKGFRAPGGFKAFVYYSEPRGSEQPQETISWKLGDGYENCYHTTNALGVRGKPETKPPGWAPPFWMLIASGCLAVIVLAAILIHIPKFVGFGIGKAVSSMNSGMVSSIGKVPNGLKPQGNGIGGPSQRSANDSEVMRDDRAYFSGIMQNGSDVLVCPVDGTGWLKVRAWGNDGSCFLENGQVVYPEPRKHARERVAEESKYSASVLVVAPGPKTGS